MSLYLYKCVCSHIFVLWYLTIDVVEMYTVGPFCSMSSKLLKCTSVYKYLGNYVSDFLLL